MAKYKIQIKNNSNTLDNLVLSFDEIYIGDTRIRDDGGLLTFETEDPILFKAPTVFYEPLTLNIEGLEGELTIKDTPSGPSVYSEYFSAHTINSREFYLLNDDENIEEFWIGNYDGITSLESPNCDLEIKSALDIYIRNDTYFDAGIHLGDDGRQDTFLTLQEVQFHKYNSDEDLVMLTLSGQDIFEIDSELIVNGALVINSNFVAPDIWFDGSGDKSFGIDDDGSGVGVWANGGCFNIHGYLTLEDQNDGLQTWIYVDNSIFNEFNGKCIIFEETNINTPGVETSNIILIGGGPDVYLYNYYDDENNKGYVNIENLYVDYSVVIDGELNANNVVVRDTLHLGNALIYNTDDRNIYIEAGSLNAENGLLEDGERLEDKYVKKEELTDLKQEVVCDHVGEITGNTNDEHGLAIDDQQMLLTKIEGQTLIANNLAAIDATSQTVSGVTFTVNKNNGTILVNGTATADIEFRLSPDKLEDLKAHHKYLIWGGYTGGSNSTFYFGSAAYSIFRDFGGGGIGVSDTITQWQRMAIVVKSGQKVNNVLFKPQLIDLTLMFGYGNEPTLGEWKAMNMPLIPYSTGYILNSKANLIATTKNICTRGQWLINTKMDNGFISQNRQNFNLLNVKIPVVYGIKYYFWSITTYSTWLAYWFDSNDKYLGFSDVAATGFVTPLPNSAYMVISTWTDASLYDPNSTPTEYNVTPFVRITKPLSYQSSELVIDEELGSWEYIDNLTNTKHSKVKSIDLGTLNWTYYDGYKGFYTNDISTVLPSEIRPIDGVRVSHHLYMEKYTQIPDDVFSVSVNSDCDFQFAMNIYGLFKIRNLEYTNASQLKAALSGVMLYYESNEEVVTPLETPIADGMAVWNGGQQIQQGQLPYKLTKQYSLSLGSQVLANVQIDKEQQAQINEINKKLGNNVVTEEYVDNVANGLYENISYEISQEVKDAEKMTEHYIGHPEGGDAWIESKIGAICIRIPELPMGGNIKFKVSIMSQRWQAIADYVIGGSLTSTHISNTSAYCITSISNAECAEHTTIPLHNMTVRFSNKTNGYYYVYIGDTDKDWAYVNVSISDVTFVSYAVADKDILRKNWAITLETSYNQSINSTIVGDKTGIYTPKRTDYTLDEIGMPKSSINAPFTVQPFIESTRPMRLFGLPTNQIIVEHSIDGGQTWTSSGNSDWEKTQLFIQTRNSSIKIPLKNGKKSCSCMVRVTITGMKYNVPEGTSETNKYNYWNSNYTLSNERYCSLDFGYFWISANYDKMYIEHQVSTGAYPNDWIVDGSLNLAQGWPGGDYVKFSGNAFGGGTTQIYNYWNHRFIFRTQASDGSFDDSKLNQDGLTSQQSIYEISCYGQNCWTPANNMMKNDRPYTVDANGEVHFPKSIYSGSGFVFSGQSDADKKLLTADGWWKHINTFARSYTKYNLYDSSKYTEVANGSTITITLNEEYGYYYIDLAMLQFPNVSSSANCTVIIKSNYANTKCVVYTDPNAARYNVIALMLYAQNGYVFPATNPIEAGYITTLVNDPYDLKNNYVEFENDNMVNAKYLLEWTEQGDCKVMWTSDM